MKPIFVIGEWCPDEKGIAWGDIGVESQGVCMCLYVCVRATRLVSRSSIRPFIAANISAPYYME